MYRLRQKIDDQIANGSLLTLRAIGKLVIQLVWNTNTCTSTHRVPTSVNVIQPVYHTCQGVFFLLTAARLRSIVGCEYTSAVTFTPAWPASAAATSRSTPDARQSVTAYLRSE